MADILVNPEDISICFMQQGLNFICEKVFRTNDISPDHNQIKWKR